MQCFAAIQNIESRFGEVEPAIHQISEEFADHSGVLCGSLTKRLACI